MKGGPFRILDNLEPQTHKYGKPEWVSSSAEFRQGNVQDYETMHAAPLDIDVVFHEAAYGGYIPEMEICAGEQLRHGADAGDYS